VAKRGLGRGLRALIPDIETVAGHEVRELPVDVILPNPFQPRKQFDESKLAELADSIKQHGIVPCDRKATPMNWWWGSAGLKLLA